MDFSEARNLLIGTEHCNDLPTFLDCLDKIVQHNVYNLESVTADLIDADVFEEIRRLATCGLMVYFGKTMRDIKCIILDESSREHNIYVSYLGPKKLVVTSVQLPHTPLLDDEYEYLEDIVSIFRIYADSLSSYFYELERIDRFCTVVEPVNPTFKEDYRRVMLDDRIWLHVEVTSEGLAANVHLLGTGDGRKKWEEKLLMGLLNWNHDEDIVENIMTIFDMLDFPSEVERNPDEKLKGAPTVNATVCTICLCPEIPGLGVPQPLCHNPLCGVRFHRICLFQEWADEQWQFVQEIGQLEDKKPLQELLEKTILLLWKTVVGKKDTIRALNAQPQISPRSVGCGASTAQFTKYRRYYSSRSLEQLGQRHLLSVY